ncbi:MAG TPA: hypothetical protein VK859_11765 [bacterium]|jgi:hypothetical protein|nr:hypothetical protein [bacterium]
MRPLPVDMVLVAISVIVGNMVIVVIVMALIVVNPNPGLWNAGMLIATAVKNGKHRYQDRINTQHKNPHVDASSKFRAGV